MRNSENSQYRTALTCDEARAMLIAQANTVVGYERVNTRASLDRILYEDLLCPVDVPQHTNSAMDGYALKHSNLSDKKPTTLKIVGTAYAGRPYRNLLQNSSAVGIMTGAAMPEGSDTVVIQEDVTKHGDEIRVGPGHQKGQHVRIAGEDLKANTICIQEGRKVTAADIGLVASLGITEVKVRRKIRVAFFSTGDELRSLGETLGLGEIYDSNRYTLYGLLKGFGADIIDMGVVKDDPLLLKEALITASENADAIITSGGVSVGEADHIKTVLKSVGEIKFWKILMKPGRPLAFGKIGTSQFYGLPGNPVSVMITFQQFVSHALSKMAGESQSVPFEIPAKTTKAIRKGKDRTEFQRGILSLDSEGGLLVTPLDSQGSGILRSMTQANCLIHLPADIERIESGNLVKVHPFDLKLTVSN